MLWSTLYNKIGKQPLRNTQRNQVYAMLENPKTHQKEKVFLLLKYNTSGHPYFVRDFEKTEGRSMKNERKIKVNRNCVNAKIQAHILSEPEMRKIGFTDHAKDNWYFCRMLRFPKRNFTGILMFPFP